MPDRLRHDRRKDAIEEIEKIREKEHRQRSPGDDRHPVLHSTLSTADASAALGSAVIPLGAGLMVGRSRVVYLTR
jgi:hypothetical protein